MNCQSGCFNLSSAEITGMHHHICFLLLTFQVTLQSCSRGLQENRTDKRDRCSWQRKLIRLAYTVQTGQSNNDCFHTGEDEDPATLQFGSLDATAVPICGSLRRGWFLERCWSPPSCWKADEDSLMVWVALISKKHRWAS